MRSRDHRRGEAPTKGDKVARIELIESKDQLPVDQHDEFDAIVEVLHHVGGPFAVLLRSPGLAEKVMRAGAQVRLGSTLTRAERELTILSVAREKDGPYEWAAHVGLARDAGVSETAIAAVRDRADAASLPEGERQIVEFVRELLRTNRVGKDRYEALRRAHDERWLVELTATIGQYQYIAAINNVFEVDLPDGAEVLPLA